MDYVEPLADTAAAVDELSLASGGLPMIAIGYSFGAIMATRLAVQDPRIIAMAGISPPLKRVGFEHLTDCRKPCLLVSRQDDFVHAAEVATRLVAAAGCHLTFERPIADHFFVGIEADLANRIAQFADQANSPVRTVAAHGSK